MRKLANLIAIVLLSASSLSSAAELKEGMDFVSYNPPRATEVQDRIEVAEFFWYGCPHCFEIEPALRAWLKQLPRDVVFRRVPAVFPDPRSGNPSQWAIGAAVYYTLEAMGIVEKLHGDLFNAIHGERAVSPVDKDGIVAWLGKKGVDTKTFLATYDSFAVRSKVLRTMQLSATAYNLNSVPTIIVDGHYRPAILSGPNEDAHAFMKRYLTVVDGLIDKARKDRSANKK
jgi:thiol:disulfide interchange protein DsbA